MTVDMLESIDDSALDNVAGGAGFTLGLELPHVTAGVSLSSSGLTVGANVFGISLNASVGHGISFSFGA